jgi:hypothetical protein
MFQTTLGRAMFKQAVSLLRSKNAQRDTKARRSKMRAAQARRDLGRKRKLVYKNVRGQM